MFEEHGVMVSSTRLLSTWMERRNAVGKEVVTSQEGLDAHAVVLEAGCECGLGAEALRKMLLKEHGVTVSSRRLLST